jgi:cob(I)alamin adenosyltransferase
MAKGYVHVYTGDGKGKTTAAFGLAVRAACYGLKVYIGQFVKDMKYHETKIAEYLPNITIEQLGGGCFIDRAPEESDRLIAKKALDGCAEIMKKGEYDVVILDEITIAIYFQLISVGDVIEALKNRAEHVEVVLTGRYAPEELIEAADLVTEMREIKHYYTTQGVLSRPGIDW